MKKLKRLIRLQEHKIDKVRQDMSQIKTHIKQKAVEEAILEDETAQESDLIASDPQFLTHYEHWHQAATRRMTEIRQEKEDLMNQLAHKRGELMAEYQQKRRFELILGQKQEHERKELAQKEIAMLDEQARNRISRSAQ